MTGNRRQEEKKTEKKMDERSAFFVLKVVNTHTVSPPSIHSFPPHSSPTATRSLKVLPAVKAGYFLALICSSAPVLGLRPTRAARSLRSKMPKPGGGDREGGGEGGVCVCVRCVEGGGGRGACGGSAQCARGEKEGREVEKNSAAGVFSPPALLPSLSLPPPPQIPANSPGTEILTPLVTCGVGGEEARGG